MTERKQKETIVKVILDGETHNISVPEGTYILDAALDEDIDIPFSCQSGICGSCRGKLLKGEVTMEEDGGLSQEEMEAGYILNCVSVPKSDEVIVEIG
jgi:ring-1,2-phenylacetyl-CoA epoxidase subunit PaaE